MAIEIGITHDSKNLSGRELFSFTTSDYQSTFLVPLMVLEEITFEDLSEIQQSETGIAEITHNTRSLWSSTLQSEQSGKCTLIGIQNILRNRKKSKF